MKRRDKECDGVNEGSGIDRPRMLGTLLSTPEGKNLAADVQRIMGK